MRTQTPAYTHAPQAIKPTIYMTESDFHSLTKDGGALNLDARCRVRKDRTEKAVWNSFQILGMYGDTGSGLRDK